VVALYVTSTETAGKTVFCAGIGKKLLDHGSKIGFMMPIRIIEAESTDGCADAVFIKDILNLSESEELICPIRLSQQELWHNLTEDSANFSKNLEKAYGRISRGKDVVIMEGLSNIDVDEASSLACSTVADVLDARVIIVVNYLPNFDISQVVQISKKVKHLMGVIINLVPGSKIEIVAGQLKDSFNKAGIKVLGIFPEIRSLLGVTVGELAQVLGGEILTCPEKTDGIVENVMLGAMTVDSGITYFGRKQNKAVVIRGERSDMQLAALETPTECLILTNDVKPLPFVLVQAKEKQVPIVVVKQDTPKALTVIEEALKESSFRSRLKLETLDKVLDSYFDFETLYSELGLKA
jgi:BioD-like phosphotransacetylase family protein